MDKASPAVHVPLPRVGLSRLGDERLAQLVGGGRERAFAALYERYHQPLYRYCRSMVHNDADAQDALQSTFASALGALQRRQRNAPLRPWLFRIAHNESISLLRRRRDEPVEPTDERFAHAPSADEEAAGRARLAVLVADLGQLPERQRSALLMRELSGLSHADIALALGISVGAAKSAVFDARSALTECSEGRAMSCEDVRRTISDQDGRALRGRRIRAHLRDCASCGAFAGAIDTRRADLRALTPVLPPVVSAALLGRLARSASGHAAGGGGGSVAAGAAGKFGATVLGSKALVGAAVVATAAAVGGLVQALPHASSAASHSAGQSQQIARPDVTTGSHGAAAAFGARADAAVLMRSRADAHGSTTAHGQKHGAAAGSSVGAHHGRGVAHSPAAHPSRGSAVSSRGSVNAHGQNPHASQKSNAKAATPTHPVHPSHPSHPSHPITPHATTSHTPVGQPAHPVPATGSGSSHTGGATSDSHRR